MSHVVAIVPLASGPETFEYRGAIAAEPATDAPLKVSADLGLAIGICLAGVVIMGLVPGPIVDSALAASWALLGG